AELAGQSFADSGGLASVLSAQTLQLRMRPDSVDGDRGLQGRLDDLVAAVTLARRREVLQRRRNLLRPRGETGRVGKAAVSGRVRCEPQIGAADRLRRLLCQVGIARGKIGPQLLERSQGLVDLVS